MGKREIVVVGGGIAGSALAFALAGAGLDVLVLEATVTFEDRVRGESMHVWGVKEAQSLGADRVLLDAGAHVAPLWRQYTEGDGPGREIPMSLFVPGVDGTLNLRHPDACQALLDAAAAAGATVERGVRDVTLTTGGLAYRVEDAVHEVTAGLVVGADGRGSAVRRQAGITLERDGGIDFITGLLLDGLDGVPDDHDVMCGAGDLFFLLFHQGGGRARSYLVTGRSGQHRFAGKDSTRRFLESTAIPTYPWHEGVMAATPAGPCATFAGEDTWTDSPFAEGVVLIGDAAGHNDPIIGEGLSIAMRDARVVRDLVLDGARTPEAFRPYGEERAERMRRLRLIADVIAVTHVEDATNRAERRAYLGERMAAGDPVVFPLLAGAFVGPETIPPDCVDLELVDRIRQA